MFGVVPAFGSGNAVGVAEVNPAVSRSVVSAARSPPALTPPPVKIAWNGEGETPSRITSTATLAPAPVRKHIARRQVLRRSLPGGYSFAAALSVERSQRPVQYIRML